MLQTAIQILMYGYVLFIVTTCFGLECLHGGTLTAEDGFCQCICASGFSGLKCEYELKKSRWPRGPYYLPMTKGGCPETKAQGWKIGYINFTTEVPFKADTFYNNVSDNATAIYNLAFEETHILGPYGLYNLTETDEWPNWEFEVFALNKGCPPGK
ncbi:uncharacterized protein LOC128547771 [Mercenaria mercenaria]|uniref:uncharacterized protein LOC128547771 n=1 Tax=Mercenaria mercenaria TaxID=6596 RepID=UPI00234E5EBC|nr:uncharacterized protein LOC128547771 [Mercenaria mercenaria]